MGTVTVQIGQAGFEVNARAFSVSTEPKRVLPPATPSLAIDRFAQKKT